MLRAVAEGGPHPRLEHDTLTVQLAVGPAEVRFAVALPAGGIGVLHFETQSLTRVDQLQTLFDLIAGTARLT